MCLQVDGRGEGELSQFQTRIIMAEVWAFVGSGIPFTCSSKKVKDLAEQRSDDMHLASRSSIPCCCYHCTTNESGPVAHIQHVSDTYF